MRPEMIESSSPYSMNLESPKASSIWSTERRLLERPPPCRPQKSGRRASLSSAYICDQESYETSAKKQRNERLLPEPEENSKTIGTKTLTTSY